MLTCIKSIRTYLILIVLRLLLVLLVLLVLLLEVVLLQEGLVNLGGGGEVLKLVSWIGSCSKDLRNTGSSVNSISTTGLSII
jgi:hypothetical protein